MELAHIKDVLAHLRIIINSSDDLNFRRVLTLCDGVGNVAARKIEKLSRGASIAEAIIEYPAKGYTKTALGRLGRLMKKLQGENQKPSEMVEAVISYYEPIFEKKYNDDWPKRKKGLEQLQVISHDYTNLRNFLTDMAIDPPTNDRSADATTNGDLVLSTIHSSKGLEWKAVFLINVVRGSFPAEFGEQTECDYTNSMFDEDRRLLYVAVTRTKEHLYILWPAQSKGKYGLRWNQVSPFLQELPKSLYEEKVVSTTQSRW